MRSVEVSAKTRKEATEKALEELGVELHDVAGIEVLDEGSRGFLGLGARDVKIRVSTKLDPWKTNGGRTSGEQDRKPELDISLKDIDRNKAEESDHKRGQGKRSDRGRRGGRGRSGKPQDKAREQDRPDTTDKPERRPEKDAPKQQDNRRDKDRREARPPRPAPERKSETPENAQPVEPVTEEFCREAASLLSEIITRMGFECTVENEIAEDGSAKLNVSSDDSAILIGRKGRSLSALQYLLNRMVRESDSFEGSERIIVDIEDYLERRKESLRDMALKLGEKAKETGRNMRVKPLNPQERRVIHVTLEDDEELRTYSVGESLFRTVIIAPKDNKRSDGRRRRGGRGRRGGKGSPNASTETADNGNGNGYNDEEE